VTRRSAPRWAVVPAIRRHCPKLTHIVSLLRDGTIAAVSIGNRVHVQAGSARKKGTVRAHVLADSMKLESVATDKAVRII
jgi:hypothetical protein